MLSSANHEASRAAGASSHPVLESLSWNERVQLAQLAASLREYNELRAGTYMYRGSFCSLDSCGRPVIVMELGSDETGLTSRRVVTFSSAEDAIEFVAQEMYFYALKSSSGLVKAQAWRKSIPVPATACDETFEVAQAHLLRTPGHPMGSLQ